MAGMIEGPNQRPPFIFRVVLIGSAARAVRCLGVAFAG